MTEHRRIATVQLTERIAVETDVILSKEVGYRIRFEDVYSSGLIQLIVMTEGLLLRELMYDQLLTQYNVVTIEKHVLMHVYKFMKLKNTMNKVMFYKSHVNFTDIPDV